MRVSSARSLRSRARAARIYADTFAPLPNRWSAPADRIQPLMSWAYSAPAPCPSRWRDGRSRQLDGSRRRRTDDRGPSTDADGFRLRVFEQLLRRDRRRSSR
jgi:hypothetical protein